MLRSLLGNIKAVLFAIGTAVVAIFGFIFIRRGDKIDELKQEVDRQKREKEVIKKEAKQEIKKESFKRKVAEANEDSSKTVEKEYTDTVKKVSSATDDEVYEVEL